MKRLLFVFLGVIVFLTNVDAQTKRAKKSIYKQFPEIYRSKDSLIRSIVPDKDYTYWEFADGDFSKSKSGRIILSKGVKPGDLILNDPGNGDEDMINGCRPSVCYKYIVYVYNGKVGYVTSRAQLMQFIGKVDNLAEAVLLAESAMPKREYLGVDVNVKGGAYNATFKNGYDFILTNYIECPNSREAIHITITKQGAIKKQKLSTFYTQKDCPTI